MGDEISHSEGDASPFKPPPAFVQASIARQAKIRQQQLERGNSEMLVASPTSSPAASPALSPTAGVTTASRSSSSPTPKRKSSKTVQQITLLAERRASRRRDQDAARKSALEEEIGDRDAAMYQKKIAAWRAATRASSTTASPPATQPVASPRIKVCVRKRPLHAREHPAFDTVTAQPGGASGPANINLHEPKTHVDLTKDIVTHTFMFDHVFDENCTNKEVYSSTAKTLVKGMFDGARGTVFAYGQTGSGKTHTMFGQGPNSKGMYEYACEDVLEHLNVAKRSGRGLTLYVSFFEIYGGHVYDLFSSKARVQLLEDQAGVIRVLGLREEAVTTVEELLRLAKVGSDERTTGATDANPDSSRSHAVFQMRLRDDETGSLVGKFSLVDLAGSERAADRVVVERRERFEGAEINKSLLALKECIRALHRCGSGGGGHIPFRASKLTQILRDSFMGRKSQTVMIATISPGSNSAEHSLNTLRYADRVKELKKAQRRQDPTVVASGIQQESVDELDHDEIFKTDGRDDDINDDDDDDADEDDEEWTDALSASRLASPRATTTSQMFQQPSKTSKPSGVASSVPQSHSALTSQILAQHETLLSAHVASLRTHTSLMQLDRALIIDAMQPDSDMLDYVQGVLRVLDERDAVYKDVRRRAELLAGLLRDEDMVAAQLRSQN
ncbi:P-loop containing nucleoside triphosphate hydrolase protein [Powellomyces hirtus]|nr:P-loop containing nucleoside triphosphate hydrolase protein [Powellomyces hirtus]